MQKKLIVNNYTLIILKLTQEKWQKMAVNPLVVEWLTFINIFVKKCCIYHKIYYID